MPFESLGAISYSPSIVTMAVSLTVSDIFSIKEWRDLETGGRVVQGNWKWRRSIDHNRNVNWSVIVNILFWVIWHWIIWWPWNLGFRSLRIIQTLHHSKVWVVSYSPSIVTMAVCLTVYELISVKWYHYLEDWVRDCSTSSKIAPFDRLCTTFYWSAIVNITLSFTVFVLFDVE